jgi:SAM-dependent methyltransferase
MTDSAAAIVSLYERHAAAYDALRGRKLMEVAWLERFCALLPAAPSVLDIGCGMGEPIARHLIERGCAVTGVDSSGPLIGLCRERFPGQSWQVADMRDLALGRRFDGLIAWDSFFHLRHDDQRLMFPLFRQHAAEGAALLFTSGPGHGEAIGTFEGEPLYHASLAPEEYRRLLGENGFVVIDHVVEDAACGGHTVWLAQRH